MIPRAVCFCIMAIGVLVMLTTNNKWTWVSAFAVVVFVGNITP